MGPSSRRHSLVRVFLIDGSSITLHGLKVLLSRFAGLLVVGTANSEAEVYAALTTCRINVIVLDVQIGRTSGIDMCRTIRKAYPHIGVLFFTEYDDRSLRYSAMLAGAQGYFLKSASSEVIVKGIKIVSTGHTIVDQSLAQ